MQPITWENFAPTGWGPEGMPEVDDVRPHQCPRCRKPAKEGDRVYLQGHGHRVREVVVRPAVEDLEPLVVECWSRRYRCTRCGAVVTVLPAGVLSRCLYSVMAIVHAFILVSAAPVGGGLSEEEAYDIQGMNPSRRWTKPFPYRWRSLDRWRKRIGAWWPGCRGISELLVELFSRASRSELREVLAVAVGSHVQWGAAM